MSLWPKAPRLGGLRFVGPRFSLLLGAFVLSSGLLAGAASAASAAPAASATGWIRLAHLSPNTPAVDVYLYSFGNPSAMTVLKHVAYGTVSPYLKVASGEYTVAMRGAGAAAGSRGPADHPARAVPGPRHPGVAARASGHGDGEWQGAGPEPRLRHG